MFQGILVILIFLVFAVLIFKNKIPTFLALMAMAILIAIASGVPVTGPEGILSKIIEKGSTVMASSIMALIFGAWLGEIMTSTGVTKDIIRRATEFGGNKPFILAIVLNIAVIVLFTAVTGLGVTIMIGTLVLPILIAVGIRPIVAGAMFIFARAVGLILNPAQWQLYMSAAGIEIDVIKPLALVVMSVGIIGLLLFTIIEVHVKGRKKAWAAPVTPPIELQDGKKVSAFAMLMPFIPFPLILGFNWSIVPAILVACIYGSLVTSGKSTIKVLAKTGPAAVKTAAPSVFIMIGIGMIIAAVKHPIVSESMNGLMSAIMPTGTISYILFFSLLSPLALYRGPFNMWGLGSGVLGMMIASQILPAGAIVAAFLACHIFLLACDPTNSHHVWTADYLQTEVFNLTKKSFLYLWSVAIVCVVIFSAIAL
ncbi:MAG: C4-dicarboxylate ABC transporter [Spirochaetia bacterium]|jgi:hypothetical protein|nr:C4-dicarboxylate ABC transporter [Spirochaetia bacterium]